MGKYDTRFCPVCKAAMEVMPGHYIRRRTEHGLFLHHQLAPHEQIKIGEFTWRRKSGDIYVDRHAYGG